jgi:hypothetical protein
MGIGVSRRDLGRFAILAALLPRGLRAGSPSDPDHGAECDLAELKSRLYGMPRPEHCLEDLPVTVAAVANIEDVLRNLPEELRESARSYWATAPRLRPGSLSADEIVLPAGERRSAPCSIIRSAPQVLTQTGTGLFIFPHEGTDPGYLYLPYARRLADHVRTYGAVVVLECDACPSDDVRKNVNVALERGLAVAQWIQSLHRDIAVVLWPFSAKRTDDLVDYAFLTHLLEQGGYEYLWREVADHVARLARAPSGDDPVFHTVFAYLIQGDS